ncbi:MAG: hypothetical protein JSR77_01510 [Planctomycetes bacterium]|nr:hypothetical protein [Planctomycetota bacterium]
MKFERVQSEAAARRPWIGRMLAEVVRSRRQRPSWLIVPLGLVLLGLVAMLAAGLDPRHELIALVNRFGGWRRTTELVSSVLPAFRFMGLDWPIWGPAFLPVVFVAWFASPRTVSGWWPAVGTLGALVVPVALWSRAIGFFGKTVGLGSDGVVTPVSAAVALGLAVTAALVGVMLGSAKRGALWLAPQLALLAVSGILTWKGGAWAEPLVLYCIPITAHAASLVLVVAWATADAWPRLRERGCGMCGYDLRGVRGEVCPECGARTLTRA